MGPRSVIVFTIAVLCLGLIGLWYWQAVREHTLLVAAGQRSSQAFKIAEALRKIVTRHHPDIRLEVFETRGSLHKAKLLDEDAVQLATVQADQVTGHTASMIADLYPDTFQIVVRGDNGIETISGPDWQAHRIATDAKQRIRGLLVPGELLLAHQ